MKKIIIEYKYPIPEEKDEFGVVIKDAVQEFFHLYIDRGDFNITLQEKNDLIIRDVSYLNEIFLKYIPESLLSKLLLNLNLEHYMHEVIEYKNNIFIINESKLSNFILRSFNFIKDKIKMLKNKLDSTDYKITKCYVYFLRLLPLTYNLEELSAQRDAWRAEINQLEQELKTL